MKAKYVRLPVIFSFLLLLSVSCSQCGVTLSKEEYIKTLDASCAKFLEESKKSHAEPPAELDVSGAAAFVRREYENFIVERRKVNERLYAIKHPSEDLDTLKAFWAEVWELDRLESKFIPLMKAVEEVMKKVSGVMKEHDVTSAISIMDKFRDKQKDYEETQSKMKNGIKKYEDLARKYGFKSCDRMETGFIDPRQPESTDLH